MDRKANGINELSATSEEDGKDPFCLKNLKHIKKELNKLILPNFAKREKLKSESSSRKKMAKENINNNNKVNISQNNLIDNNNKDISKNKSF